MLLEHFPLDTLPEMRDGQRKALLGIENAIKNGVKYIAVEAPVGAGKSAIAITLGRWSQNAFIVTPTKSLQGQYKHDYPDIRVMSGRRAYPCTYGDEDLFEEISSVIRSEKSLPPPLEENSCAKAPCIGKTSAKKKLVTEECDTVCGGCPYNVAIDEAFKSPIVVQNLHSFYFQTSLAGYFPNRRVLVIDEAHDLEDFLRSQISTKIQVNRSVNQDEIRHLSSIDDWLDWLKYDEQYLSISKKNRDSYLARLEKLEMSASAFGSPVIYRMFTNQHKTVFEWIPSFVGNAFHEFIGKYADIVVFMSGTIFDPKMFFNPLGIKSGEAAYIRLESDFPAENRPVVLPRDPSLDLSYDSWNRNLDKAVDEIKHILNYHKGQKGLIHTASYRMSDDLAQRLANEPRLMFHTSEDFSAKLAQFFKSDSDAVFVSPSIQQGIDAHGDRARFQILMRPQNLPTTDPWVARIINDKRWDIYFYKSLIVFAQQLGRPVRSKTDTATTYLLSSTYNKFLSKTRHWMPAWLQQGFVR